jgi:hypothetical protein
MAIDRENEQVIPLRQVPRYVPSRSPGKRVAPSTVWRWAMRRHDPLETFATPGGRFTSVEAVGRFIDRISTAKGIGVEGGPAPTDRSRGPASPRAATRAVWAGEQLRPLIDGAGRGRQKPSGPSSMHSSHP